jgi:hypothetical protein
VVHERLRLATDGRGVVCDPGDRVAAGQEQDED